MVSALSLVYKIAWFSIQLTNTVSVFCSKSAPVATRFSRLLHWWPRTTTTRNQLPWIRPGRLVMAAVLAAWILALRFRAQLAAGPCCPPTLSTMSLRFRPLARWPPALSTMPLRFRPPSCLAALYDDDADWINAVAVRLPELCQSNVQREFNRAYSGSSHSARWWPGSGIWDFGYAMRDMRIAVGTGITVSRPKILSN